MSPFEYVTVLISIILGLGITQILSGIAELIHKSERVKIYWPLLLWIVFVLLLHIQEWWLLYELKAYQPWRLPTFLFVIAYPINLFVLARMLFPIAIKGKIIDLRLFYFTNCMKIFIVFTLSAILAIAYNMAIMNLGIETQLFQILLASTFLFIMIKKVTQEWVHKALALIVFIVSILSIIITSDIWLID